MLKTELEKSLKTTKTMEEEKQALQQAALELEEQVKVDETKIEALQEQILKLKEEFSSKLEKDAGEARKAMEQ